MQISEVLQAQSYENRLKYASKVVYHAKAKRQCALIITNFCCDLPLENAARFVCELITLPAFQDIPGKLTDFMNALKCCTEYDHDGSLAEKVELFLPEYTEVNEDGDLVDSDADENGNLR